MSWVRKGILIKPNKKVWWMRTHAMLPTVRHLKGNYYRIYYSGRDDNGISHIGFSDVEINGENIIELNKSKEPSLLPGERGCFDDNGVTPSCFVDDKLYSLRLLC